MDKWVSIKDRGRHIILNMKKMSGIYFDRLELDGRDTYCINFSIPDKKDAILAYKSSRKRKKAMKAIKEFINIENMLLLEIESDR